MLGGGAGFCRRDHSSAHCRAAEASFVLCGRNEWSENMALWGSATNASNIYCQEIFIANYMHMKQDLIPDPKRYQARNGVKTGCVEVQQGE